MADDPTELELLAAKDDFRAKDRLDEVRQDVSNSVMQGGDAVSAALEQARKDLTDAEERAQITYGGFQPETLVGMEVVQLKTKITLLKRAMQEMDSGPTSQIGVVSSYQKIERSEERRVGKECRGRWSW